MCFEKTCTDLLNAKKFHELHDFLEKYWFIESNTVLKNKIQALIQLSVALYHFDSGNFKGFQILCGKAEDKLKVKLDENPQKAFEALKDQLFSIKL